MSRIGKRPVQIPDKVQVRIADRKIAVEGPLGKLDWEHRPEVDVSLNEQAKTQKENRQQEETHALENQA